MQARDRLGQVTRLWSPTLAMGCLACNKVVTQHSYTWQQLHPCNHLTPLQSHDTPAIT